MPERTALLSKIERRDRQYRIALLIFMLSTALAISVLAGFQIKTNAKVNRQLVLANQQLKKQGEILSAVKASGDERTKQLEQVNQHVDCIAAFFNQRNRTNATITDLDQCSIEHFSGTAGMAAKAKAAPKAGSSSNPQATPSNTQQQQNNQQDNQQEKPAVEILGLPICVPFTTRCVR